MKELASSLLEREGEEVRLSYPDMIEYEIVTALFGIPGFFLVGCK